MVYRFVGKERIFWPFETPNELGIVLAGLVLLAVAISVEASGGRRWIATGAALVSSVLLGLTYSRSGMVALGVGLAVTALLSTPRGRLRLLAYAGLFAAVLLFTPHLVERVSVSQWREDAAVTNRLAVWSDATRLLADHPGGVGREGYRALFNGFYKRADLTPRYVSAVNTYLTVACFHGIAAFSLMLLLILGSLVMTFLAAAKSHSLALVAIVSIQAAFATAACFNNFLTSQAVLSLWCGALFMPLVFWRDRAFTRADYLKVGALAGGSTLVLVSTTLLFGAFRNRRDALPMVRLESATQPMVATLIPRTPRSNARILVAIPAIPRSELNSAPVLKRLAALGTEVSACIGDDRSPNFSSALAELAQRRRETVSVFIGFGSAARLAPLVAAQTKLHASAALLVDRSLGMAETNRLPEIPSLVVAVGHQLRLSSAATPNSEVSPGDPMARSTVFIEATDPDALVARAMEAFEKWMAGFLPAMGSG